MFGLGVLMHRHFELGGWITAQPAHPKHRGYVRGWRHGVYREGPYVAAYGAGGGKATVDEIRAAKRIDWSTDHLRLREALPPAFTAPHIRVAPGFDGATWLDLGRNDGRSVRIHATGRDVLTPDPQEVCWRRTQLTGELPLPAKDTNG